MNIKELMGIGSTPPDDEFRDEMYVDHLINAPWFGVKELSDNIGKIPDDRIYEVSQNIDDCIGLLALAKLNLQQRKN